MNKHKKKRPLAVIGRWLPMPLDFLKSRACAELSVHASKLLLDVLALLGTNCIGNGDLSLAPKAMAARGWTSRSTLRAAMTELINYGLLIATRKGSRNDCALYACTLFPLDCDMKKLDVKPGAYRSTDYMG